MLKIILSAIAGSLVALGLDITAAHAQRVFVAAQGSDGNPCTFALPCRTFQHAHDVVAAGGEVLDPAGYGALTISKTISIQGHDFAGISVGSGATGITINAGNSDRINLRGLILEGAGVGFAGIVFNSGKSLTVANCVFHNIGAGGINSVILFKPTSASSLAVSNTLFTDNTVTAIKVQPSGSAAVDATFDHVVMYHNNGGIVVIGNDSTGTIDATATDSVAGKGGVGFEVISNPGAATSLMLVRSVSANNNVGIEADGANATLRIAQSTVTANVNAGFRALNGAAIETFADNYIRANGTDTGSLTIVTRQ